MSLTARKLDYPYITSNPGIAGGIIVSKQMPIGETLRRLLKKVGLATRADFKNRIDFL